LAKAIGVTQGKICKIELGVLKPSESDLQAICRVLRFDESLLTDADLIFGLGGDFLYRRRVSLSGRARRRIEAEANIRRLQVDRLLRSAKIESRFGFPAHHIEEFGDQPERVARAVRRAWKIPGGPIANMTRLIESAGGIVFAVDFETDLIDGTNIRIPGRPPLFFLNKNVSGERHRFNLAHELAHAVMHFSTVLGDAEKEANQFAAEFLMPAEEIRPDLRNLDLSDAARLKSVWGVSMAAIIQRARDLGRLTESNYRRLFTVLSASGQRRRENFPLEFEKPEAFDNLVKWHRQKLSLGDDDMDKLLFTGQLGPIDVPQVPTLRLAGGGLFDGA
jgi:Zn-dependent peptidase ImmA (M78 family)